MMYKKHKTHTTICPVEICTRDVMAKAEAPPPAGSTAKMRWFVLLTSLSS